jgi:hypothetical protein
MEMWDEGDFGFNDWSTTAGTNNWVISSQNGNDAPSAQFNWDPDPGAGYAISLTSAPLNADLYTEGDIWLDFEYYLNNRNSSGTEMLAVEVYDGNDWNQVASFANTQSFDWTPQHLKITDYAMSRVFSIRFTAMGENSFDVIHWNVDNIYVYRMCEAPSELDGDYYWTAGDDFGAEIFWEAPEIPVPPQGWIRWDDGVLFSGIGLTDGGDFVVAARWDAGMLDDYMGTSITTITMAPNDDGYTNINMKVWKGANAGTLLWESGNVQPVPGVFNDYTIDPPIPLDTDDELWIGYDVLGQPASTFPAGTDAGPAVAGYGDKISTNGTTWDNLSDFGLDYNWSLAAYVETLDGQIEVITPLVEDRTISNETHDLSRGDVRETGVPHEDVSGTRDFMGFNIYRMGPDDDVYDLIDFVAYEEGVLDYNYFDDDPFGDDGYPYEVCYQVTSVWESETDYCESMPATSVIPIYDYVCIMVTGIDNPLAGDLTALYPNPASDRVNVTSTHEMQRITVVNYVGQVVYDKELNADHQITLNTSSYDAGVYVVRLSTDNGVITKRLTITK